jgi:hypothetical protein
LIAQPRASTIRLEDDRQPSLIADIRMSRRNYGRLQVPPGCARAQQWKIGWLVG